MFHKIFYYLVDFNKNPIISIQKNTLPIHCSSANKSYFADVFKFIYPFSPDGR